MKRVARDSNDSKEVKNSVKQPAKQVNRKPTVKLSDRTEYFTVHYLPNYLEDYRHDPHAEAIKLGDFPGASNLLDEIRSAPDYVPGVYRVTAIDREKKIIKSWALEVPDIPELVEQNIDDDFIEPESIERERVVIQKPSLDASTIRDVATVVAREVGQAIVEAMPKPAPPQAAVHSNGYGDVRKVIKEAKELVAELTPQQKESAPTQEKNLSSELSILVEAVKLAKEADDPSLVEVIRDYFNPPKEPNFIDSLGGLLEKAIDNLPTILQLASRFVPAQAVQQVPQLAQSGTATTPGQGTQQQIDPVQRDFQKLMMHMVADCVDNVSVIASADRVDSFLEKYPENQAMIGQLVISAPSEVLKLAGAVVPGFDYTKYPHSEEWIAELQAELKAEDEDQGEQESQEASKAVL